MGRPLKTTKAQLLTVTATSAVTDQVTVSQNLNTLNVVSGQAFVLSTTVGTLIAGTTYWILKVVDATHFTVSSVHPSANPDSTVFPLGTAGPVTVTCAVNVVDWYFNNPAGVSNTYSVVGGNTTIYGNQVKANVAVAVSGAGTLSALTTSATVTGVGTNFSVDLAAGTGISTANGTFLGFVDSIANATSLTLSANAEANASGVSYVYGNDEVGYIVRQKGKQKYLVHGLTSGLEGACYMANAVPTALQPGQMSVIATYANAATGLVQSLSDHTAELFTANSGPVATGNIVFEDATPVYGTFNAAATANAANGQPYPIVVIDKA